MTIKTPQAPALLWLALFAFPFFDMLMAFIDVDVFIVSYVFGFANVFVGIAILYAGLRLGVSYTQYMTLPKVSLVLWALLAALAFTKAVQGVANDYVTIFTFWLVLIGPILFFMLQAGPNGLSEKILSTMVYSHAVYCLVFVIVFSFGLYQTPFEGKTFATFPGFPNIRHVGYVLAPITLAGVFLWSGMSQERHVKAGHIVCLTILWTVLLYSGSRAALGSCIIGFLVTTAAIKISRKNTIKTFLGTSFVGFFFAHFLPSGGNAFGVWNMFERTAGASDVNALTSRRIDLWQAGLEAAFDKPLFGHGMGNFSNVAKSLDISVTQAHNSVIEYIYAFGFIGGTCLAIWVLALWIKAIRRVASNPTMPGAAAIAGLNVLMGFSLLDGVFYYYKPILITVILFAIALNAQHRTRV